MIGQQLQNLYQHAHEIIIVTGRVLEFGDKFPKTPDRTIPIIKQFKKDNDPEDKIRLIRQETWPGKDHMVEAYYASATGDYVWHVDADEFYSDNCIVNTKEFIARTEALNYAHDEYYYYRYYNVVIAKDGTNKFWNCPARIHKVSPNRRLIHRPQILVGSKPTDTFRVPRSIGIRHHYSIMSGDKVATKAHFYGYELHRPYLRTYELPLEHILKCKLCVRPDNDRKPNSFAAVLGRHELEIPRGIDELFDFFKSESYPWTVSGYEEFRMSDAKS